MTVKITNPQTGQVHEMDKAAFQELRECLDQANEANRYSFAWRGMEMTVKDALRVLAADV